MGQARGVEEGLEQWHTGVPGWGWPWSGLCGSQTGAGPGPEWTAWAPRPERALERSVCSLTRRALERTVWAPGTERLWSGLRGLPNGANCVGSRNGADCVGSRNGAGSVGSRGGTGSGADSVGSRAERALERTARGLPERSGLRGLPERSGSGADSVGSWIGAGSGADSMGSRIGAGSGAAIRGLPADRAECVGSRIERALERTPWAPGSERALERTPWALGSERALERTPWAPGSEWLWSRLRGLPDRSGLWSGASSPPHGLQDPGWVSLEKVGCPYRPHG